MIVGLGIDVVHVLGLASQLEDPASHFAAATFTAGELAYSHSAVSRQPARHLAARFAAKEAAVKAFDVACRGAGITPRPMPLTDIEVERDDRGRPSLRFSGGASELLHHLGADRAWVSLSHDGDYATAVVALERLA